MRCTARIYYDPGPSFCVHLPNMWSILIITRPAHPVNPQPKFYGGFTGRRPFRRFAPAFSPLSHAVLLPSLFWPSPPPAAAPPPHAWEAPLSVSLRSIALPRGEPSARPWTEVNFVVRQTKRPLLLCGYSKRSRFPLKAPTGARPQDAGGTSMGGGRDSITTMRRPALQPTPAEGPYLS